MFLEMQKKTREADLVFYAETVFFSKVLDNALFEDKIP